MNLLHKTIDELEEVLNPDLVRNNTDSIDEELPEGILILELLEAIKADISWHITEDLITEETADKWFNKLNDYIISKFK